MFNWTAPVQVFGSTFQAMAYSSLPAAANAANQIYAITDFGNPYVLVQSNGSVWVQISAFSCAWASLPSATTFAGFVGYTSISGIGTFRIESRLIGASYKWRPMLGAVLNLISFNDDPSGTTIGPINPANETLCLTGPTLPADFIQVKDRFILYFHLIRGGTLVSNGSIVRIRMGTSDTPTNNAALIKSSVTGTTNTVNNPLFMAFVGSDTKSYATYENNGTGVSPATAAYTAATLESIAANAQKLTITLQPGGTAETVTLYRAALKLEAGV